MRSSLRMRSTSLKLSLRTSGLTVGSVQPGVLFRIPGHEGIHQVVIEGKGSSYLITLGNPKVNPIMVLGCGYPIELIPSGSTITVEDS